ncbi:dephospho-CoA kinase [Aurantimicrobium minutum]|uniref:dephospho-CoA kinase n=1 Tax=Aurantimicrobium minutum TaxID=708131 RepID=UPI0024758E3B|nr:dephospho-CoA kinase [Aurantimicrobium minutum]MDH6532959.1 dephospho-CoA kinase [Aurantimicrobium minutum]
MTLIGLTGGIGSGKSTIARRLAEHGAHIVDADQIAREVVEPGTPALAEIIAHFGAGVLNSDGSLNRSALGEIVFTDETQREMLNSIVHPAVHRRTSELFAQAPVGSVVVYDVPLLVEANSRYSFDAIVVASAPESIRVERLMEHRGMLESEALSRIQSQAPEEERLKIANHVIDTSGNINHTYAQVDALWNQLANID